MSANLAKNDWCIVSGLATGCDTVAHLGALDAGGKTVAILPTGLGKVYPAKNKQLSRDIIERGGCLVSEYLPMSPSNKGSFIERDRLQSALSQALLVLETKANGGTVHTVQFGKQQGRVIACLKPHSQCAVNSNMAGNHILIEEGAIAIIDETDLGSLIATEVP